MPFPTLPGHAEEDTARVGQPNLDVCLSKLPVDPSSLRAQSEVWFVVVFGLFRYTMPFTS